MNPSKRMKANTQFPLVPAAPHNETNSLIFMLEEGRRLSERRNNNIRCTQQYPPMDTQLHRKSIQSRGQMRDSSLDTTFHATSHLHMLNCPPMDSHLRYKLLKKREQMRKSSLDITFHSTSYMQMKDDDMSLPSIDSVDSNNHASNDTLFVGRGKYNEKLIYSIEDQHRTSIDLSNVINPDENATHDANALCVSISTNFSRLQSLCLHNCQIDDSCAKYLGPMILSKKNLLKSLILSKNKVTDVGAKMLLDAMKSHHCILQEFDLSHNQLTSGGIASFADNLSALLHLKVLHLADAQHLVPLSIYQQFKEAIEKNVVLDSFSLGGEVMDGSNNEGKGEHNVDMVDDLLLRYWHGPQYTAITDHIRLILRLNYLGFSELLSTSRIDANAVRDFLGNVEQEKQLDACFRLIRLRPDILISVS